jgi:hypothetical protein
LFGEFSQFHASILRRRIPISKRARREREDSIWQALALRPDG